MITHFAELHLHTVSIQGVKQFYHNQMRFDIAFESDTEIHFRPTPHTTLVFTDTAEPIAPVHMAFEVAYSAFDSAVSRLEAAGITLLQWSDGRAVDDFETGKNVYFRDGEGHLLELISHTYVKEGVVEPNGVLEILYMREIGFPVDEVASFRQKLVQLLHVKLDRVFDDFTFAIGGTAHAVVVSKKRKWVPIAMTALPPSMEVCFGVSGAEDLEEAATRLEASGLPYERTDESSLEFELEGYRLRLALTRFPENTPRLLQLPQSQ
ncbi:glyoxalase/bleomycin resistance/dioxygenase family protein [Paenibacillus sp. R14(2021)]|uniref:glyoxalase/bleomycin resistance/dioxygenase family protein n=1 Tax=Paenibacillus sp. R14(2021) TaxID=2859228 RepID=UPI001C615F2E|nr:glyoxalase/bleomycin resistance/dioxygenase family protein [Paenibacillus sp. R14(2021)]